MLPIQPGNRHLKAATAVALAVAPAILLAQSLQLPEAPGKATAQKLCGSCHGADDQFYEVVDYLANNFSKTSPILKINVNKATPKDLENALRIPAKQAAAT